MPPVTVSKKISKRIYKKEPIITKKRESVITLNISTLPVDKNQEYTLNTCHYAVADTLISKYSVCYTMLIFEMTRGGYYFSNIGGLHRDISDCRRRYSVAHITLRNAVGAHSNVLIVDKEMKVAERYEPHHLIKGPYISSLIDHLFDTFFKFFFPDIKYLRPIDYCLNFPTGFQSQYDRKVENDYHKGLCSLFALLYLEYRLEYPTIERSKLLELLDAKMKTLLNAGKLYDYLRQFAQRYENITGDIGRSTMLRTFNNFGDITYIPDNPSYVGRGKWIAERDRITDWSEDSNDWPDPIWTPPTLMCKKFADVLNGNK